MTSKRMLKVALEQAKDSIDMFRTEADWNKRGWVDAQKKAERLGAELAEIKGSLSEVAVYEGLIEGSPTARLVAELVRDHEELEARIDAVLSYLSGTVNQQREGKTMAQEIARLLRGGIRVPDTPEGLDG